MCLCVAGRLRHIWHPTATYIMPLIEMLVHSGTILHEMVFLQVIIKYLFKILWQQPGLFALLPCFSVYCAFFCVLTPCSPVGGYSSLSSLSHTAVQRLQQELKHTVFIPAGSGHQAKGCQVGQTVKVF